MSRFKPIRRDTDFLFPPSMNDGLPEHHLARFIVDIVEQLDLRVMEHPVPPRRAAVYSGLR